MMGHWGTKTKGPENHISLERTFDIWWDFFCLYIFLMETKKCPPKTHSKNTNTESGAGKVFKCPSDFNYKETEEVGFTNYCIFQWDELFKTSELECIEGMLTRCFRTELEEVVFYWLYEFVLVWAKKKREEKRAIFIRFTFCYHIWLLCKVVDSRIFLFRTC